MWVGIFFKALIIYLFQHQDCLHTVQKKQFQRQLNNKREKIVSETHGTIFMISYTCTDLHLLHVLNQLYLNYKALCMVS